MKKMMGAQAVLGLCVGVVAVAGCGVLGGAKSAAARTAALDAAAWKESVWPSAADSKIAGIAACPCEPGFKKIVMAPQPDRWLGHVTAEYRAPTGLIRSAWRYEGEKWSWDFTVPSGSTAVVTLPGTSETKTSQPGSHHIEC